MSSRPVCSGCSHLKRQTFALLAVCPSCDDRGMALFFPCDADGKGHPLLPANDGFGPIGRPNGARRLTCQHAVGSEFRKGFAAAQKRNSQWSGFFCGSNICSDHPLPPWYSSSRTCAARAGRRVKTPCHDGRCKRPILLVFRSAHARRTFLPRHA